MKHPGLSCRERKKDWNIAIEGRRENSGIQDNTGFVKVLGQRVMVCRFDRSKILLEALWEHDGRLQQSSGWSVTMSL